MADYLDISIQEYMDLEDAKVDFSFTCLHKCAQKFGVDITDLVIGENPRLSFFDVTKKDKGSIIIKRNGFKYKQIGAMLKDKLMESFIVDAPYDVKLLNQPVAVSTHQGQELTFILEGSLKVQ
ncbi:MAG: acyl-CoA synthetase, partial [Oscillospiraceae bacterium]